MQQQTNLKHTEQLNTQNSVEETHRENSNSELLRREPIENTPFIVIGNEENGYFIAFGHYRLTDTFHYMDSEPIKLIQLATNILEEKKWHIICNLALIMAQETKKVENIEKGT